MNESDIAQFLRETTTASALALIRTLPSMTYAAQHASFDKLEKFMIRLHFKG